MTWTLYSPSAGASYWREEVVELVLMVFRSTSWLFLFRIIYMCSEMVAPLAVLALAENSNRVRSIFLTVILLQLAAGLGSQSFKFLEYFDSSN